MTRILFPTDFSEHAREALRYALPIIRQMQAELILLHVYTISPSYAEAPAFALGEEVELQRDRTLARLQGEVTRIREKSPGQPVEILARLGGPVHEILEVAREERIDCIVMGTRGASGLREFLIGSNAARVIAQAPVPVLAIPPGNTFKPLREIFFATDYLDSDLQALGLVLRLARLFGARIRFVHVRRTDEPNAEAQLQAYEARVRDQLDYPHLTFQLLEAESVQQGLEHLSQQYPDAILAMCPQRRGLFERLFHRSHTQSMSQHASHPLLALPVPSA
ncbi:MAG: universal stress protein [Bacteroidetes bacterium]|nr:MAG: universal stress protein [Bacteroidota bacterium]